MPEGTDIQTLVRHPECACPEQEGTYMHWEELRQRTPPQDISSEAWWWAVKLARRPLGRPLQLRDQNEKPFTFAMTDTAQRLVHEVDRDASGHIALPED